MTLSFWGLPGVFAAFVDSVIERVSVLQGRLQDLDNPQVELHLLCSCLGVCKLNHLLCMVSPDSILPQLRLFDSNLHRFCLVYATALYLIKPGVRLPCLFLLVA